MRRYILMDRMGVLWGEPASMSAGIERAASYRGMAFYTGQSNGMETAPAEMTEMWGLSPSTGRLVPPPADLTRRAGLQSGTVPYVSFVLRPPGSDTITMDPLTERRSDSVAGYGVVAPHTLAVAPTTTYAADAAILDLLYLEAEHIQRLMRPFYAYEPGHNGRYANFTTVYQHMNMNVEFWREIGSSIAPSYNRYGADSGFDPYINSEGDFDSSETRARARLREHNLRLSQQAQQLPAEADLWAERPDSETVPEALEPAVVLLDLGYLPRRFNDRNGRFHTVWEMSI